MATLNPHKIKYLVVHCTATMEGKDFRAKDVDRWHRSQGWSGIGYHYLVCLDGTVEKGRPRSTAGAHCKGYNSESIGICYVGGLAADNKTAKDTRTDAQKEGLKTLLSTLKRLYPYAKIVGHHDLNRGKACPCFDAKTEYAGL